MATIKCPKCGEVFTVDESDYAKIVNQVKDDVFQRELKQQTELLREKQESEKKSAVNEAVLSKEKEIAELKQKVAELSGDLQLKDKEKDLAVSNLEKKHADELKLKEDEVAFYRDFKAKLSTKAIGESLEQYCLNEFNKLRMTAFPDAEFGKDNKVSQESGSKGDFIFKDKVDGVEYLSIMFEMKNENDTTATKHKNEDFFKELDKDRHEKGCEYAVLVSMLEPENDFYNAGIVDVSYAYLKMYVVRPQCFLTIIGLLANASKNSISSKKELARIKSENADITMFEEKLETYKQDFLGNVQTAQKKFEDSIEEIDKTISHLTKIKEALLSSGNQLRIANNKVQDVTIRRLTNGNPTMKAKFEDLKK